MRMKMSSSAQSKTPLQCIYGNTSQEGESRWWIPPKKYQPAQSSSDSYPRGPDGQKRRPFISDIFEHAAQAHEHLSEVCANVSALAKVTDKATLLTHDKWSRMSTGPAKTYQRGFLNLVEDRTGQNDRGREKERRLERWCSPSPMHPA